MANVARFLLKTGEGEILSLLSGRQVAGSGPEAAVCLPGAQVQAAHLVLTVTRDRIFCQAAAPEILFRVNGRKTSSEVLRAGDRLEVAGEVYTVAAVDAGEVDLDSSASVEIVHPRATQSTIHNQYRKVRDSGEPTVLRAQLDVMYRLAQLVGKVTDTERFSDALLDLVLEVLPVDRALLVSFGDESRPLHVQASRPAAAPPPLYPPSVTVLERVRDSGVAMITSNAPADERLSGSESITVLAIRRVLCAPLFHDDTPRWAIYADGRGDGEPILDSHLEMLESIASYAGVALDRSYLVSSLQERELHTHLLVHDMKNPLASLMAGLGLIELKLPSPLADGVAATFSLVQRAADQLNGYINDIMDVAQLEERMLRPRLEEQDLANLQDALAGRWEPAMAFHGHRLILELDATPGKRFALDRQLLNRVLDNLVENALRHGTAEGSVTVRMATAADGGLRLEVRDSGSGVPPEARERIFDKFGRAANAPSGGRGLGLYFCRLAVEAHGGQIRVEGGPGDNRFVVTLPGPAPEDAPHG